MSQSQTCKAYVLAEDSEIKAVAESCGLKVDYLSNGRFCVYFMTHADAQAFVQIVREASGRLVKWEKI